MATTYPIGHRFGRLVLRVRDGERWSLACDCGRSVVAYGSNVRRGRTTSCGCFRRETTRARSTTHGLSKHWVYKRWAEMVFRCTNAACDKFDYYGGRGITVCDRWRDSFEAFLADMGMPPTRAHSIDRIDNEGAYAPENCRWATSAEQGRNRRPRRAA